VCERVLETVLSECCRELDCRTMRC